MYNCLIFVFVLLHALVTPVSLQTVDSTASLDFANKIRSFSPDDDSFANLLSSIEGVSAMFGFAGSSFKLATSLLSSSTEQKHHEQVRII